MNRIRPHRLPRPPTARRGIEALERRRLLDAVWFDGGGGDGLWNNPANWFGHMVPTAQDDVSIGYEFNVTLAGAPGAARTLMMGSSATLNVQTGLTIGANSYAQIGTTFNLEPGGTLDGPGDLNLLGSLNWTGGTMQGQGQTLVGFGGQARLSGTDTKDLRRTLRIEQSGEVTQGALRFEGGALEVDARATLLLNGAQLTSAGGTNRIDNAGRINSSGFLTKIDVPLYHSGTAELFGSLNLTGGGSATGTFELFPTESRLLVGGPGYAFGTGAKIFGEGAALWFSGGTSTVAEPTGLAALTVSGAQATFQKNLDVAGQTLVEAPTGVLNLAGPVSSLKSIRVETGSRIRLTGDGTHVMRTTYPGVQETARLDVGREAVIFDYPPGYSSLSDVRFKIADGYLNGAWSGSGICSEIAGTTGRALGYGEASTLFAAFPATFMGQAVDDTSILVRYTRYGDANLDGTVNLADFNRLAGSFGATDAYWTQGDFNYDQTANLQDFNLLAGNFGQTVSQTVAEPDEVEELLA